MQETEKKTKSDDFWNIEKLLPKEKPSSLRFSVKKPQFAEVKDSHGTKTQQDEGNLNLNAQPCSASAKKSGRAPSKVEYDDFSPLIFHVEIADWPSSYNYYEYFCKNAVYFYDKTSLPCERVPFFSYVAQYSQMNRRQLDYYLWWRENVRKGVFLEADISYIFLFYYEIINLGNFADTEKGLAEMISVWAHYRKEYPQLNSSVAEWVCDYSLIHHLPIKFPNDAITREMICSSSLKETFYCFDSKDEVMFARFLLEFAGGYSYKKSKFYTDENKELYDSVMLQVFSLLISRVGLGKTMKEGMIHHASRVAYMGALCSSAARKHIEVDYLSLNAGSEIRTLLSDIMKYTENQIRMFLGVRSKLTFHPFPEEIKKQIDLFFRDHYSLGKYSPAGKTSMAEVAAYEKLYDAPENVFDVERALSIEASSWNTTDKLLVAFQEDEQDENRENTAENKRESVTEKTENDNGIKIKETADRGASLDLFLQKIKKYRGFLDAVVAENFDEQKKLCRQNGWMPEAVADEINEAAVEFFEDILLEEGDKGFIVIDDYKDVFTSGGYYAES